MYTELVQPPQTEHILSCKDSIAQQYLIDCIVHAFPDEYHIETLETLLQTVDNLNKRCDINVIYIQLMERFADYSKNVEEEGDQTQAVEEISKKRPISEMTFIYDLFKNSIANVIEKNDGAEQSKLLELMAAFINFSVYSYPSTVI